MTVPRHALKVVPPYLDAIAAGVKPFEIRRDDRPFTVGDVVHLREWQPTDPADPVLAGVEGSYTGRDVYAEITYVLRGREGEAFGLRPGYAVLGIALTDRPTEGAAQ